MNVTVLYLMPSAAQEAEQREGAEGNKERELLENLLHFVLPKSNSCCKPLQSSLLRWQNTRKFAELDSSQYNNK